MISTPNVLRSLMGAVAASILAVPTALAQGTPDMGTPGTWHLTKIAPNFNVAFLPVFFGQNRHLTYKVMDGEIGKELAAGFEKKPDVKVLGRIIDIGDAITFMKTAPSKGPGDYAGKRLRIAGSASHAHRYEAIGAQANVAG